MLRRFKRVLFIFAIFLIICSNMAWGEASDNPSDWAKLEVEAAIENSLVPNKLMEDYTRPITRSEYTLLALKLLEKSGHAIEISEREPFTDVKGHEFEDQLVKAYNAGIINGYGNRLFKPNNNITREEIAALVVKLLKQIRPDNSTIANESYDFVDRDNISQWARAYVDYCYENSILRGVSELEIAPKGDATIEQSIVLLYRLSKKEGLIEPKPVSFNNAFSYNFGSETAEIIKKLSEKDHISLIHIKSDRAILAIQDSAFIEIINTKYEISLYTSTVDLDNELFKSAVIEILETLDNKKASKTIFNNSFKALKDNEEASISEKIGLKDLFQANSEIGKSADDKEYLKYNFNFHDTIE